MVHLEQSFVVENIDAAVQRCLLKLEPKVRELITNQRNFKIVINATQENKRRYRFRAEVYETFDLE